MKGPKSLLILIVVSSFLACEQKSDKEEMILEVQKGKAKLSTLPFAHMPREMLYDKVLGTLVGSAIGDAMGAPTEMWARESIDLEYGFVDSLDNMIREPSPEGTWDYNLPAGGTTDDTRWKVFLGQYMVDHMTDLYVKRGPDPFSFASYVVDQYEKEIEGLKATESFEPAPFEEQMWRIAWLQEFALVAKPYADKDLKGYHDAVNKFYGGDMACPGLLYSPLLGVAFPGAPENAYQAAYELSIFDIGYARDIMALSTAMVAAAMPADTSPEKVMNVLKEVDPEEFFRSRLLGRISYRIYRDAVYIVNEARKIKSPDEIETGLNTVGKDKLYMARMQKTFDMLEERNQDVPFHSGEIHLINLTALLFADFDFRKAMEFVINYGRDNDTVAAVTGAILGAYYGYEKLPDDMKKPVIETNRNRLGIDLEALAANLTDGIVENGGVSAE